MNKYIQHLKTITKHKIEVAKVCFKFGLYWQGLVHDLSKYSIAEFAPSAKYFNGKRSPIDMEKAATGYSNAWLHHKSHNKHHQWYWMDWDDKQRPTPCKIPIKYVYEMIADWIGAGKVYGKNAGKEWDQSQPYEYYKHHNRQSASDFPIWHPHTKAIIDIILVDLAEFGLDVVVKNIKNHLYEKYYTAYIEPYHKGHEYAFHNYAQYFSIAHATVVEKYYEGIK